MRITAIGDSSGTVQELFRRRVPVPPLDSAPMTGAATRRHVSARILAAVAGGYAVSNVAAVGLAHALPLPRADAVMAGVLATYLFYAAAVVWCFSARTVRQAWLGILLAIATFGGLALLGGVELS